MSNSNFKFVQINMENLLYRPTLRVFIGCLALKGLIPVLYNAGSLYDDYEDNYETK